MNYDRQDGLEKGKDVIEILLRPDVPSPGRV